YDDSLTIYQSGVFTCLLENANGCRATDTISAIYHKTPLLSLYAIPDKCLNEADFPLDSFADPKGGVWRAQDTIVVLNNAFLLSKAVVKPYMLFYDYTDSTTTCSNSASITFTVKKVPDIVLLSPLSYCDEDRLIDLSAHVSPQNGYWDTLHPAIVNAHYFNPHLAALVSNPLSYQVDSSNGCSNLLLIDYIINPTPEADFTADSLQGQSPLTVQFTNLSVISAGNLHYLWYFGDGDSSVLEDPSHVFLNTGSYDVRLIAVSDSLCRAERTKSKFIEVFTSLPDLLTGAVSVYPNPAQDQLIIESTSKLDKVILYNFLGAKIRETDANNESKINLERGKLPSGLYLLKMFDKNGDVYVYQVVFK
ncbi:MAG: T9SS type A sorting domain-containing protein, partial [Patescibacteria group bacterium]